MKGLRLFSARRIEPHQVVYGIPYADRFRWECGLCGHGETSTTRERGQMESLSHVHDEHLGEAFVVKPFVPLERL